VATAKEKDGIFNKARSRKKLKKYWTLNIVGYFAKTPK
jgi:hypothetical protein